LGLESGARERLRIRIDAGGLGARKRATDLEEQRARPASDVEDSLAGLDTRLVEESSTRAVRAEKPVERVVERQEEIVTGGGKERAVGLGFFAHEKTSTSPRPLAASRKTRPERTRRRALPEGGWR